MNAIRKKLIEVSIPLEAINAASAREKSIRHGHPSTLHLWWARRPLAACRAVLFAQLVDDPSSWPDRFPTEEAQDAERRRLHRVIEDMVPWEASNNEAILNAARWEIARSIAWGLGEEPPAKGDGKAILDYLQTKAPPVYDPFSGGGSIPLEAQRLGLRAYGSDLNPVAVLIGKALVEIPPKFAGRPPVNPKSRAEIARGGTWNGKGAQGLAEDVRYYGQWMRDEAEKRIGHLYPKVSLGTRASGPTLGARASRGAWASHGARASSPREGDGEEIAAGTAAPPDMPANTKTEATVIAWLWARTVRSPDPAAKGAMVPLVSSFMLSTKEGKKAWVEPVIAPDAPDGWRFEVKTGSLSKAEEDRLKKGTKTGRGTNFECVLSGATINPDHVRSEGLAKRLGARLMAIVAEGDRGRIYLSPQREHEDIAASAQPGDVTSIAVDMPNNPRWFSPPGYGMKQYVDLFTPRQLAALTTFSDLVAEAREKALADALGARASRPHAEWHRRRLPHWEAGEVPQAITFRLAGSLPSEALDRIAAEVESLPPAERASAKRERLEALLDSGAGPRHLARADIASCVQSALQHFDGARYHLHAWCIMPNHVHVLVTPLNEESLSSILHSWKSFTAKQANRILESTGTFWQEEYFDRVMRDERQFEAQCAYIHDNPVKAGLCAMAEDWPYSSAGAQASHGARASSPREAVEEEIAAGTAAPRRTPDMAPKAARLADGGAGAEAYADAVATYLAFSNSRMADRHSSLSRWDPNPTGFAPKIANTFSRQALPMVWDYTEGNPFSSSSGNFEDATNWVAKNVESLGGWSSGGISNFNASKNSFPIRPIMISTDPPYYDNIGYADLSDYFYIWLRRSLSGVWPDLFRRLTTPKAEELVATPYRHGGKDAAEAFFIQGMGEALAAMRKAATDGEPLTIYYAFKQSEVAQDGITSAGWASFLQAVVDAGLVVDGTWPIRTELANRMIGKDANALASSIVLVCRKRAADAAVVTRSDFIRSLRRELPDAIDAIRRAGVGPVDMQQSVIGPGMGVFSRHAKVLEDDDSAMSVKTALTLINRVWEEIDQELDAAFDPETQVALAWFATYGFDARASGELITLANAKNVGTNALFESGVFKDLRGKAALTPREELPRSAGVSPAGGRDGRAPGTPPRPGSAGLWPAGGPEARAPRSRPIPDWTVWECVQHAARVLNAEDGGGAPAGRLVAEMGPKAAEARALAYRLFEIATQKGWVAEARIYNELAQEWPKLEDLAVAALVWDKPAQADMFEGT